MRIDSWIEGAGVGIGRGIGGGVGVGGWMDRVGIGLSACCGVHCLVTPGLLVLLPAVGGWFASAWVHWVALGLIGPVAVWALWRGGRRAAGIEGWSKWGPLGLGVLGLGVLTAGAMGHPPTCCPTDSLNAGYGGMDAEAWRWVGVNVAGSAMLVAGHGWNLMRMREERVDGCGCVGCGTSGASGEVAS